MIGTKWYKVVANDDCSTVEKAFGITLDQFLAWNPAVSSDCSQNFWTDYVYCVGVSSATAGPTTASSSGRTTATTTGAQGKHVYLADPEQANLLRHALQLQ